MGRISSRECVGENGFALFACLQQMKENHFEIGGVPCCKLCNSSNWTVPFNNNRFENWMVRLNNLLWKSIFHYFVLICKWSGWCHLVHCVRMWIDQDIVIDFVVSIALLCSIGSSLTCFVSFFFLLNQQWKWNILYLKISKIANIETL